VKREKYIKYQLIQGLVEQLVDPESPVPTREQPEALSVLHSLLTDMGASQGGLGGTLRQGPLQEGRGGQALGQERGKGG